MKQGYKYPPIHGQAVSKDDRMLNLQEHRVNIFESQGKKRMWVMWGCAAFVGFCILLAGDRIGTSLDSYCPEDTGVVFRLT